MRLYGKVSTSVNVVSGEHQGCVFGPYIILYTCDLFHIVENHIVSFPLLGVGLGIILWATSYAVIPRRLSRHQVTVSLNQGLAVINSLCLQ